MRDDVDFDQLQQQLSGSTSSVNIPQEQPSVGASSSQKDNSHGHVVDAFMWRTSIDVQRHKEILVKSISATLLLLLKHFRLNHVYQFEHVAQHLVFANCIPLILKFFDQNIHAYVMRQTDIEPLNYPNCVIFHAKSAGRRLFPIHTLFHAAGTDWPPIEHLRHPHKGDLAAAEPQQSVDSNVFNVPDDSSAVCESDCE